MVFNAIPLTNGQIAQYNLLAGQDRPGKNSYINGRSINDSFWSVSSGQNKSFEFDRASQTSTFAVGTLGYGRYRFEFWFKNNTNGPSDDYVDIELDYNHGYFNAGQSIDLVIELIEDNYHIPRLYYKWACMPDPPVSMPTNRFLKGWEQVYPNYWREKDFGNFKYNTGDYNVQEFHANNYDIIPQDPRRDCVPFFYPIHQDIQNHRFNYLYTINSIDYHGPSNIGVLTLKLTIEKNVSTPVVLTYQFGQDGYPPVFPSPIVVTNGASLILSTGSGGERTFEFKKYTDGNYGTNLAVEGNGKFELLGTTNGGNRAHVTFNSYCYSTFDAGSFLNLGQNSKITLQGLNGNTLMTWARLAVINAGTGAQIELKPNS